MRSVRALAILLLTVWLTSACTTQQHSLNLEGEIPKDIKLNSEQAAYARRVLQELRDEQGIDTESEHSDLAWLVFTDLIAATGLDLHGWNIHLVDSPDVVNVRALHGKRLFVWSGTLKAADGEDELAGLMALGLAHALARHARPVEFHTATLFVFSLADMATTIGLALASQGVLAVNAPGLTRYAYIKMADLDPMDRAYSEEQERKAAHIALSILEKSRYCPRGLVRFWKRVKADGDLGKATVSLSRGMAPEEWVSVLEVELDKRAAIVR